MEYEIYFLWGALVGVILLLIWNIILEIRLRRILRGKNAKNLEDTIATLGQETDELKKFRKELEIYLAEIESRVSTSIRGVSTVRFNPFQGTGGGGNQSFASAFLDEKENGVVFSSLYSRDRVSVYAKPIVRGKSEFELTDEEKDALKKAKPVN